MYMKANFKVTCLILLTSIFTGCSGDSWWGSEKKLDMPGVRESLVVRSKDLVLAKGDEATPMAVPVSHKNDRWVGYYNEMAMHGSNFEWNKKVESKNSLSYASETYLVRPSLPIIDSSSIVTLSADGTIAMYDRDSHAVKWANDFFEKEEKHSMFDFIINKFLAGGLRKDGGMIYASSGLAKVIAINAENGETAWITELSSPVRSMPIVYENIVIFHSIDNKVFALDKNTGATVWTYIANSEEVNALNVSAPQIVSGKMVLRLNNDEVVALNPETGEEVWTNSLANKGVIGYVSRAALNYDNTFFVNDNYIITTNSFAHVFKIDLASGEVLWSKDVSSSGKSWVAGNNIFFISNSNEIICLSADNGAARWVTNLNKLDEDGKQITGLYIGSPVMANGNLYVPNNMGELVELDAQDGKITNKLQIGDDVYLPPIYVDGVMHVLDNRGNIAIY